MAAKKPKRKPPQAAPSVTAEMIFHQAYGFEHAANLLHADTHTRACANSSILPGLFPEFVVDALAVELYLKCLIYLDSGRIERGHDLLDFYQNHLRLDRKQRIEDFYSNTPASKCRLLIKQVTGFPLPGLVETLRVMSHAFEDWRYAYEYDKSKLGTFDLHPVAIAVREVLIDLHPVWQKYVVP